MNRLMTPLLAGLLFGAGLVISGMANPANVLGFLTLGPGWNPSLAFVMGGALTITLPGFFWLRRRGKPFVAEQFVKPPMFPVDRVLLLGAALFGVGWGLAGFCPGPAIVSAGLLQGAALLFVPAFLLGGIIADLIEPRLRA
jgi:uncharacterized protein